MRLPEASSASATPTCRPREPGAETEAALRSLRGARPEGAQTVMLAGSEKADECFWLVHPTLHQVAWRAHVT